MADRTKIEWCDASWSPVTGCTKVSAGCANCYAERMFTRFYGPRKADPSTWGKNAARFSQVVCHPDRLDQPLHWRKPRRVFVCSMGDLFHEDVPDNFILNVLGAMCRAPQHIYMILTKRAERMRDFCKHYCVMVSKNLWLGVTVENQETANERIPLLLRTPAAVRFVSVEPMLGPVDIEPFISVYDKNGEPSGPRCNPDGTDALGWVICGGETGPGARPMRPDWARSLRDQCQAAGVPFFFEQMSRKAEIPSDLMIREFPCSR